MVQKTSEAVEKIQAIMLTSQSRQKSYADPKHKDMKFQVGDHVFLQVSPLPGVGRLALPPLMLGVHDVVHVFVLRKYVSDTTHVLKYEDLELQTDLSYEERPVHILDQKE
ncbi:uncharacterized protein LOC133832895 [Humulus lupulus]|uniref:uncharacterized protein LOC133832895 n=1 Tax=Humulus lupulus TaxID=3486 RepID=UPI002B413268|nr:uncharacterized protein LOC133832895 [Humulus lupulus]